MRTIFYHSIEATQRDDGTIEVIREINEDAIVMNFSGINSFLSFLEQYYTQCAIDFNSDNEGVVLQ